MDGWEDDRWRMDGWIDRWWIDGGSYVDGLTGSG